MRNYTVKSGKLFFFNESLGFRVKEVESYSILPGLMFEIIVG